MREASHFGDRAEDTQRIDVVHIVSSFADRLVGSPVAMCRIDKRREEAGPGPSIRRIFGALLASGLSGAIYQQG